MKKIVFVFLALWALSSCKKSSDSEAAQRSADEFAAGISAKARAMCTTADSDGDGYCSCTVLEVDRDPLQILCGCEPDYSEGCGHTKPVRGCKVRPMPPAIKVEQR